MGEREQERQSAERPRVVKMAELYRDQAGVSEASESPDPGRERFR